MNQLVKSAPVSQAPIVFQTADDFKGHLVCIKKYDKGAVFCKKFYKIDDYFCLEGVKTKATVCSSIKSHPSIGRHHKGGGYYEIELYRYNNVSLECYRMSDTKMIKKEKFEEGNSFKEELGDWDGKLEWLRTSMEEGEEEANKKQEEKNVKAHENNMKLIPIMGMELYSVMIDHMREAKPKLIQWVTSLESLRKKYPKDRFDFDGYVKEIVEERIDVLLDPNPCHGSEIYISLNELKKTYLKSYKRRDEHPSNF